MKAAVIVMISVIFGGLTYATISLQSATSRLEEQLQTAMSYQQQLQEQTETNTRQRLEFESRIEELEADLLEASSRVSSLGAALVDAESRENPEYEALLEQARREIAAEMGQPRQRTAAGRMFGDANRTRRMAEDRVAGQFDDFLEDLGIGSSQTDNLYAAMVDFNDGRYQMLGELMAGNLTADQAAAIFGPSALAENLAGMLTPEQAAALEAHNIGVNREAARTVYSGVMENSGNAIAGEAQDLVMDVLMDELFSAQNNYGALVAADGSMTSAYNDKLAAFERARDRLENDLSADQLMQFDSFVEHETGSVDLVLEANDDGEGNVQVMNMKASAENLPN
ncbi:MAG: hypothetical protein OXU30_08295 [Gammaproteobacteria bacterium]|nr:hypothetical protein [Gammaproteobacteria bacterium]